MKVNNEEIWQKIKDGVYKGFSIEAICGLDELINNNTIELSMDKEFIAKLREIIYEALGQTPKAEEVIGETVEEVAEEQPIQLESEEEIAKLKEDVANLTAEVERLKSERDELESKLKDAEAEKEKMNVEMEAVKNENIKLSKQPSVEPAKQVNVGGKNYAAAVKLMLK